VKKLAAFLFFAVIGLSVFGQTGFFYTLDTAIGTVKTSLEHVLPSGARVFVVCSGPAKTVGDYAADELTARLVNSRHVVVVERSAEVIKALETESGYQLSGEVDDATIQDIGHKTGAEYLVSGNISGDGIAYRLVVKAVGVRNGELAGQWNLAFQSDSRFDALMAKGRRLPSAPDKPFSTDDFGGVWNGVIAYSANGREYRDTYRISFYEDGSCWVTITDRGGMEQAGEGIWFAEEGVFHLECEFQRPVIERLPGLRWVSMYVFQNRGRGLKINVKPSPEYAGVVVR
jgi:TolB-like protein